MTDEDLVFEIIRTNNNILFAELYQRFSKFVYINCYGFSKNKQEAEDLKQDVFVMLFLKIKNFKGMSKFSTWLYSFTYNFCVNYVQRNKERKKEKVTIATDDIKEKTNQDEIDSIFYFELKIDKLQRSLDMLYVSEKKILLMKYQKEMSIKEISKILNIGDSAVKMRLKRTKEKVKKIYNEL
ncbi:RNA polymerase sigma factor [Tenacibaculum bernardetii]|nr:sigma-70 family RNA polymerase sigma factor [Tenacibaculum bernardetii]